VTESGQSIALVKSYELIGTEESTAR